jgi:guanine nucleotide-binding protein G(i) subunit alpha
MDPISIIETAGAIANILDVISKTISAIRQLREEWNEADFRFLSLTTQLTALRNALVTIQAWISTEIDDLYHRFVIDFDNSISCCKTLIGKTDAILSSLHRTPSETLNFSGKAKLVFGGRSINDVWNMIQTQTSACTLLLTDMNGLVCP